MSAPVVRFAPSPTGRIHIGNARTALLNYLFAARQGGTFILRFDDTDVARSTDEFARSIEIDLGWLGIAPQATFRQSDRIALYEKAADRLKAAGSLYPAYETPGELDRRRKLQQARGLPPVYDRAALRLSPEERARLEAEGRKPHWRFRLDQRVVEWNDGVRGPSHIDCASLSDPVMIREDGTFLYTFTSVVDDIDMGVTDIIRGEDHVTNTAVQIQLFESLADAGRTPRFAHHNLLVDATGGGLSKRTGALSIASLRDSGVEAMAVASLAVLTGTSDEVHATTSLVELAQSFDLAHISRNSAKFDPEDLRALTQRTLHRFGFEDVRERLAAHDIVGARAEAFWLAVRGNLDTFLDVVGWWRIVEGEIEPIVEDAEFCREAAKLLPAEPFDDATWVAWTGAVKAATGRKGRALFHPLRLALTGRENGPELTKLLPLIGRARAASRLGA